jgi:chromosome segregation ATPase
MRQARLEACQVSGRNVPVLAWSSGTSTTLKRVSDAAEERGGIRARGEEAVGELAQALVENPIFNSALSRALGAGERAMGAQRSAMGALNVASASDIERLEQRLRSLSGRLEALEDRIDDLADELAVARRNGQPG